jgi:hypothetical protein
MVSAANIPSPLGRAARTFKLSEEANQPLLNTKKKFRKLISLSTASSIVKNVQIIKHPKPCITQAQTKLFSNEHRMLNSGRVGGGDALPWGGLGPQMALPSNGQV